MKDFYLLISLAFLPLVTYSQVDVTIAYDPSINLHLGYCLDYDKIFESKQECFTKSEKEWIDGGAVKTVVSTLFITSHKDLSSNFNLSFLSDIKASLSLADGLGAGGSTSFNFSLNKYFRNISNSIYFVVKAETSHGRIKSKNLNLQPAFQKMLDDGDYSTFISRCGSHYVRFETRKSSVYAIISINNIEKEIKNHIISKFSSSANISMDGFGSMNASTSLEIDNLLKEISKYGKVQIDYVAQGSDGIKSFSPTIAASSSFDISTILKNLSTSLDGFDKEKSAPVEYVLASFKPFGLNEYVFNADKLLFLKETQANINQLYDAYNQLQEIKNTRFEDYLLYFKNFEDKIVKKLSNSSTLLKTAYNENAFDVTKIPNDEVFLKEIIWPSMVFDNIDFELSPTYSEGISESGERKLVLTSLAIVITGSIRHSNYYNSMLPLRFNDKVELVPTNGYVENENNPSLGQSRINEFKIKERPFLLRLESFNVPYKLNSSGLIDINNELNSSHSELLKELKSRKYIVFIKTTNDEFFGQKIAFKFNESEIQLIK